jgi:hypothetical protein
MDSNTITIKAVDGTTNPTIPVKLRSHLLQRASQLELQKTQGLPAELHLKIGMIVDMTCNPDTSDGLSNDAWGIL